MNGFGELVIVFVIIIFCMMLHELAHGYVAYLLGDDTAKAEGRLTLNPLKHLDPVLSIFVPMMMFFTTGVVFGGAKPVPVDSRNLKHGVWGMALVALAGPMMNFLLALIAAAVGCATGVLEFQGGNLLYMNGVWGMLMINLVYVNLGFGVFNLIPIPPLDGSRVLYAVMPDQIRTIMEGMERWGIMIVMILVLVFPQFLSQIMGGAIDGILTLFSWLVGWI